MKNDKEISVLIPTMNRLASLAVTLTGLQFQTEKSFEIIIADQSETGTMANNPIFTTLMRVLEENGCQVSLYRNYPPKGMAEQRQFLLDKCNTAKCLYLDDDVLLEPFVLRNLKDVLNTYECGFAGMALIGLSYREDCRPEEMQVEFWDKNIVPETIMPEDRLWQRYKLHNAANVLHLQEKLQLTPEKPIPYKVAWVGGCVMYDTEKLRNAGGFDFWKVLPEKHCGEDVLAQLRVMKEYGGCGILPSGAYHLELETSIPDRKVNAPEYLKTLLINE